MNHQQQQQSTSSTSSSSSSIDNNTMSNRPRVIMQQSRAICPQSDYLFKKHKCDFCDYRSNYKWVVRRHVERKHGGQSSPDQSTDLDQSETESQQNDGVGGGAGENISSNMEPNQSDQPFPTISPNSTRISHQDDDDNDSFHLSFSPPLSPPPSTQTPQRRRSGVIISNEGSIKRSFEEKEGPFDLRLIENFKIFCQGPSRSGKSTWVYNLLKHLPQFVKKVPEIVIYVFAEWQEKLDDLKNEKLVDFFIPGNDQIEEEINKVTNRKSSLIIFDDQTNSQTAIEYAARLFTVDGRHSGKSCIWISQHLFDYGKNGSHVRSIRTNTDYLILFKCPGDCLSIQTLSRQMGGSLVYNIHQYITSKDPYSYLMINITQTSNEKLKYISHIFEREGVMRVYVPQMK